MERVTNRGCKYGGLIAFYKLENWWDSLTEEERNHIRRWYSSGLSSSSPEGISRGVDDPAISISTSQTLSGFLNTMSLWAINEHCDEFADNILDESLKNTTNHVDLHFTFNGLIESYYKRRDEGSQWVDKCIEYCLRDIELFPSFRDKLFQLT